jgi:trk system potassium uptake protein TrkA
MRVLIVGGGRVGQELLKMLVEEGNDVMIVESDREVCERMADSFDAMVICGDGTDGDLLESANISDADVVIAALGNDNDNLMVCQLVRRKYDKRVIVRANSPANTELFEGVADEIVNTTQQSAIAIKNVIGGPITLAELGDHRLIQFRIGEKSPILGKNIEDWDLPDGSFPIMIYRKGDVEYPRLDRADLKGSKKSVEPGDILLIYVEEGQAKKIIQMIGK